MGETKREPLERKCLPAARHAFGLKVIGLKVT